MLDNGTHGVQTDGTYLEGGRVRHIAIDLHVAGHFASCPVRHVRARRERESKDNWSAPGRGGFKLGVGGNDGSVGHE